MRKFEKEKAIFSSFEQYRKKLPTRTLIELLIVFMSFDVIIREFTKNFYPL
jgi:hypothetical protein